MLFEICADLPLMQPILRAEVGGDSFVERKQKLSILIDCAFIDEWPLQPYTAH